jgi:hypothetical protein
LLTSVRYPLKITNGMAANEDTMVENKPHKRRTTKFSRSARNKRIVERLRQGFGYDEIGREEKLSEWRVRQIVKQALEGREALESAIHAHMQIDRVGQALRVAADALAEGDIRAVAPFIKALEKLDHYQSLAREAAPRRGKVTANDSQVMKLLVDRIRGQVLDECRREAAAEAAAPDEACAAAAPPLAPELQPAPPPSAPPLWRPPVSPFGTWPGPREPRSPR